MRFTRKIYLLSLFLALGFTAAQAGATEWFVDKSARGGNNGTSWTDAWTAFSAIRWGAGGVQPGDTLSISGGSDSTVYNEALVVDRGGTASAPITIRVGRESGHNGRVIIDGGYRVSVGVSLNEYVTLDGSVNGKISFLVRNMISKGVSSDYHAELNGVKISHVEIADCGTKGAGSVKPGFAHGIHLQNVRGADIGYNVIHGSYKDGINLGGSKGGWGSNRIHHNHIYDNGDDGVTGSSGLDIYNNLIHDLTDFNAGHPDGVQVLGNYTRIYNNVVYNGANSQIFWDSTANGQRAAHARIYNNLVYLTDPSIGKYVRGIAVKAERNATGVDDLVIANNTVVDMGYFGIGIDSNGMGLSHAVIKNNIVYNSGINSSQAITLYHYSRATDVEVDYNLINAGKSGNGQIIFGGAFKQVHGFSGEPSFVNYSQWSPENDFRLLGSVPRGADMSANFTTDIFGSTRSAWNLGCAETASGNVEFISAVGAVGAPAGPGSSPDNGSTASSGGDSGDSGRPAPGSSPDAPSAPKSFRILE